jgi:hypothetical protein
MRSGSVMVCAFAAEQIDKPTSKANSLCIFFPSLLDGANCRWVGHW